MNPRILVVVKEIESDLDQNEHIPSWFEAKIRTLLRLMKPELNDLKHSAKTPEDKERLLREWRRNDV